jgi:hypothetical protein
LVPVVYSSSKQQCQSNISLLWQIIFPQSLFLSHLLSSLSFNPNRLTPVPGYIQYYYLTLQPAMSTPTSTQISRLKEDLAKYKQQLTNLQTTSPNRHQLN